MRNRSGREFEGPPKVPRSGGAVRAPFLSMHEELFRSGQFFPTISQGESFADAIIRRWEDITPAERENQKHLHRPGTDAADGGQPLENFELAHLSDGSRGRNNTGNGFVGNILDGSYFRPRQSGGAQSFIRC